MNQQILRTFFGAVSLFVFCVSGALADNMTGRVKYAELYKLSTGVDGIVDGIAAKEGERVLAGTQLLSLADAAFEAEIAAASASLALVEGELAESKRSFERDQALYDEGSLSTVELDLARIETLRQKSRVAGMNAALVKAKSARAMSQIIAPVAGMVVRLNVAKGQRINMSALQRPMMVFAGNALKVVSRIESDSTDIPRLLDKVQITVGDTSVAGTVRTILSRGGKTVVTFSIDESQPALTPGAAVTIKF